MLGQTSSFMRATALRSYKNNNIREISDSRLHQTANMNLYHFWIPLIVITFLLLQLKNK